MIVPGLPHDPAFDCPRCPRLVAYRAVMASRYPGGHNGAVPSWGDPAAWLAIVGLAPGAGGANRTGRPFTGDMAGDLLFAGLAAAGLTEGVNGGHAGDGFALKGAIITNAVHCVPPENKPSVAEIHACRPFLEANLRALPGLRVVLALGQIAHQSAVKALGGRLPKARFAHGAVHRMPSGVVLVDSYHPSRYNQNTGRITAAMFAEAVATCVQAGRPNRA